MRLEWSGPRRPAVPAAVAEAYEELFERLITQHN